MIDFVEFYLNLVLHGLDIEKVPKKYRDKVREALEEEPTEEV